MSVIHANIPASALPTELAAPNTITTEYESFTLIPRMGPLSYSYYRKRTKYFLLQIIDTIDFIGGVIQYAERWQQIPVLPAMILQTSDVVFDAEPFLNVDVSAFTDVQVAAPNVSSRERLSRLRRFSSTGVETANAPKKKKKGDANAKAKAKGEQVKEHLEILKRAAKPNPVMAKLAETGDMFNDDGVVSKKILGLTKAEQIETVLSKLRNKHGSAGKIHKAMASHMLGKTLGELHKNDRDLAEIIKASAKLRKDLTDTIAERLKGDKHLATLESIDDSVIAESREWAFLRKERVVLDLGKPGFRGPLSVNSVSPNSELTLSQSHSTSNKIRHNSLTQSRDSLTGSNIIANQLKQNMGTLFDYGSNLGQTMSEEGYERDSSRSEKRTLVESTLTELSEANASQVVSVSTSASNQLREYKTEGKDAQYATSEVAFEVFSPVTATHYLDGIGAVWCPRIKNPFAQLKRVIRGYGEQVESEYLFENFVPDPAEPTPTYEGIDRISVNTPRVRDSDIEDETTYTHEVEIRLSEAERSQGYFLSSDVKLSFHQDDSWNTDSLESNQYEIHDPVVLEHVENSHIRIRTKLYIIDENTINPDSIWLTASVTKYKYTQSYLEQLKEYSRLVNTVNKARRRAVEAQAKKYARLKRDELVRKYESNIRDLKDYAFVSLMKEMFRSPDNQNQWSYYQGIIKSCIDWGGVHIEPEPASPDSLSASGLSPYHFLNVKAIRFFLPIHPDSEEAFFDAVGNSVEGEWATLFDSVKDYIGRQRDLVGKMRERMNDDDKRQLTLDQYDSELVLGRHLESVLSSHAFKES